MALWAPRGLGLVVLALVMTNALSIMWLWSGRGTLISEVEDLRHALQHALKASMPDEIGANEDTMEAFSGVYRLVHKRSGRCNHTAVVGGGSDAQGQPTEGGWTVCWDHWDQFPGHKPRTPCVIYSFGIANDFSFDDAIHERTGCDVHSFDPSMGIASFQRRDHKWFWNIGISDATDTNFQGVQMGTGQQQIWTVMSLEDIMKKLNHTRLELLKIDVEYAEWSSLLQMLKSHTLDRVDQLLFEVHFWPSRDSARRASSEVMKEWGHIIQELQRQGFGLYSHHENPLSTVERFDWNSPFGHPCCYELSWIRQSPSMSLISGV